ncbi:MAG: 2,4-dihydroxyhept-2-ene-1,7-dioic acid aldolase, partial [Alphaproteobacteria bacterium]|nr:2,4-dihydroxyhept-2-ene-1,7-dioic acid aldolase [Alphaproteobacteria bacterium]
MKKNGIIDAWDKGESIVNGWSSIANTFSSEIMAASGFDS